MPNLSQAQLAFLARSAGMPNPDVMAAIAMAESGGNPRARNPIPPDNSYGLWQINMLGSMGPARRREFGIRSNTDLYDPVTNARAAAKILSSQGLGAWSTYTNGAYRKYMGRTSGASSASLDPLEDFWNDLLGPPERGPGTPEFDDGFEDPFGMGDVLPDTPDLSGLTDLAKLGVRFGEWASNPRSWLNALYVVAGGALVLMTLSSSIRSSVVGNVKGGLKSVASGAGKGKS